MTRDDIEIKNDVLRHLRWDSRVPESDINIEVENGHVSLRGTVPSFFARAAAVHGTECVMGVTGVDHLLVVIHGDPVPHDRETTSRINQALERSSDIDAANISVDVNDGLVTLRGSTSTYAGKHHAETLAGLEHGVREIINELAVVPTADLLDEEIAADVMAALERNALIHPEDLEVQVRDGIVTLDGAVPSWAARRAAIETVRCGLGVIDVCDRLSVPSFTLPRPSP
jgi:osmotically-inducible protein OsmY